MKTIALRAAPGLARSAAGCLAALALAFLSACERSSTPSQAEPPNPVQGAPIKKLAESTHNTNASTPPATTSAAQSAPPPVSTPVDPAPETAPAAARAEATVATPPSLTPTAVASPAPTAPAPKAAPAANSSLASNLGFEQLAGYTFEVSDELLGPVTNDVAVATEKTNAKIPATVKAYDGKKVALKGFMLPLKVEGGLVTEMLIMKDQSMCCYGTTPRINDWVSVKMKKKGVRPTMDLPVTLHGTMRIGEMRENGYLVGIYSMDGEEMDAPEVQ